MVFSVSYCIGNNNKQANTPKNNNPSNTTTALKYNFSVDEYSVYKYLLKRNFKIEDVLENYDYQMGLNTEMKDLVDSTKINELKKEIKDLQKAKAKFEKAKEKKANKGKKKEVVTDGENPEENVKMEAKITDEALGEAPLNESFTRMQKLAGIIK